MARQDAEAIDAAADDLAKTAGAAETLGSLLATARALSRKLRRTPAVLAAIGAAAGDDAPKLSDALAEAASLELAGAAVDAGRAALNKLEARAGALAALEAADQNDEAALDALAARARALGATDASPSLCAVSARAKNQTLRVPPR